MRINRQARAAQRLEAAAVDCENLANDDDGVFDLPETLSLIAMDIREAARSLERDNARLRAALKAIKAVPNDFDVCPDIAMRMYDHARAALAKVSE